MVIKRFVTFINEAVIKRDDNPNHMTFWHGGNLDDISIKGNRSGRSAYGSGLYLAKSYNDAIKYAKGSRKLYRVVVEKGTDIKDVKLDIDAINSFMDKYISKAKQKEIKSYIDKNIEHDKIDASIFNNLIINYKAISNKNQKELIHFLVNNGIDYEYHGRAGYFHGDIMTLFNIHKIVDITRVTSKDKIEDFEF